MKTILACAVVLASMATASVASANVKNVDLYVGRMATPESCFVQVDLKTVEENMFNGQEKLRFGEEQVGTFEGLLAKSVTLSPGKSVLFGSPAFVQEVGFEPDVSLANEACAKLGPDIKIDFLGSFGDVIAALTTPNEFPTLTVVGALLSIHLESQSYTVKSLNGEKQIGNTGGSSSGETSSGGELGGESPSGGTSGSSSNASGGSAPASTEDDGGCSVAATGAPAPGLFAAGGIALAASALRRRRSKR